MKTLEKTPVIHSKKITSSKYIGTLETESDIWEVVKVTHKGKSYLVAGSSCNTGLLPSYAMEIESSTVETLQELAADLDSLEYPSSGLLEWHGSMVI